MVLRLLLGVVPLVQLPVVALLPLLFQHLWVLRVVLVVAVALLLAAAVAVQDMPDMQLQFPPLARW